jgi:hypothetical protein
MLDDVSDDVKVDEIRGSDAPIDTVMIIAMVLVVVFVIFIYS